MFINGVVLACYTSAPYDDFSVSLSFPLKTCSLASQEKMHHEGACVLLLRMALMVMAQQVPCFFIFGDSLSDSGNNNRLLTLARADYPPYGIDFPQGPTGRFSNGLIAPDVIGKSFLCLPRPRGIQRFRWRPSFMPSCTIGTAIPHSVCALNWGIHCVHYEDGSNGLEISFKRHYCGAAELLGFEDRILPYSQATPQMLVKGANFASAAAGIREETGRQLGARVPLRGQVEDFHDAAMVIAEILGSEDSAAEHLSKCIFIVGMGGNDYLNNYFVPGLYPSSMQYTPEQYAAELVRSYTQHLTALYMEGARKVAIFGVGPVGCTPSALSQHSPDGETCVEAINDAVRSFNSRLPNLVNYFNARFEGARFTYINVYAMFDDIHNKPCHYGITVTNVGCCGVGRNNGQMTCLPFQVPCPNRNEYLFWDAFHPTEAVGIILGKRCFEAEKPSDAYPIDIRRLAEI
ncbi:GDSL esterase/lipase [Nymphaea thermarum]|nr:GDSL esterase/lipase [Nymphaea thermarum]